MSEMVPYTYSFCRRCDSRVELGRVAYGATIACPACGSEFVIAPPHRDGAGQGRGGAEDAVQGTVPIFVSAKMGLSPFPPTAPEATGGASPLRLFLLGTFSFPLRLRVLWQTLTLCAGAVALVGAFRLGDWCVSLDGEEVDRATRILLWNGLLLSIIFGAVALPAWIYMASAYGMTILRETACGADVVADWPNVLALEESRECLYVIDGVFLAALPGVLAAPWSSRLGSPMVWGIGACIALLFPILLLSMLEANSAAHPLSWRVSKSLVHGAAAWIVFHLTTVAAGFAVVMLEIALRRHAGWATHAAVTGVCVAVGWMIYFRLIGRLAWFLAVRSGGGV